MTTPQEPGRPSDAQPPDDAAQARPHAVDHSFWAGIGCVLIGFVLLIRGFTLVPESTIKAIVDESAARQGPGAPQLSPAEIHAVFVVSMVMALVIMAVIAGLWIMFLAFLRGGRHWARVVITATGGLWIVLSLSSATGGATGDLTVAMLAWLQIAAIVATIVYAHLPESNRFLQPTPRS